MKKFITQCLVGLGFIAMATTEGLAQPPMQTGMGGFDSFASLDEVQAYLQSRGFVESRKRTGALQLSGDVRSRWIFQREDHKGAIPPTKFVELPRNRYRSDFNLYINYTAEDSWMTSHMSAVAVAGGENVAAGLDIDRAFLGYSLYQHSETQTDMFVEVGRSCLGDMFESNVQFNSDFDGIHLYASRRFSERFPYQVILHGGPFVVNMKNKQYAWVAEGVLNRLPQGFSVKLSVIDWGTFTSKQKVDYKYLVWQALVGKTTQVPWFCGKQKRLYAYGSFLFNANAKASPLTANKKQNQAIAFGVTLGSVKKSGDWSATMCYEYVEALSVPTIDISGIGKGTTALKYWPAQLAQGGYDSDEVKGFTNYKGVSYLFNFGITDTLSLRAYAAYAQPTNKEIMNFKYRKFDIGLISTF